MLLQYWMMGKNFNYKLLSVKKLLLTFRRQQLNSVRKLKEKCERGRKRKLEKQGSTFLVDSWFNDQDSQLGWYDTQVVVVVVAVKFDNTSNVKLIQHLQL